MKSIDEEDVVDADFDLEENPDEEVRRLTHRQTGDF